MLANQKHHRCGSISYLTACFLSPSLSILSTDKDEGNRTQMVMCSGREKSFLLFLFYSSRIRTLTSRKEGKREREEKNPYLSLACVVLYPNSHKSIDRSLAICQYLFTSPLPSHSDRNNKIRTDTRVHCSARSGLNLSRYIQAVSSR